MSNRVEINRVYSAIDLGHLNRFELASLIGSVVIRKIEADGFSHVVPLGENEMPVVEVRVTVEAKAVSTIADEDDGA